MSNRPLTHEYHTIIIGAGPAGMFAAQELGSKLPEKSILLIEKMKNPGRKLLLSGAGECNLTNSAPIDTFINAYGKNGRFLKHALYKFTPQDLLAFFQKKGVTFRTDTNGKIFPENGRATIILDILRSLCSQKNLQLLTFTPVQKISKIDNGFSIFLKGKTITCTHLILATGGLSYPGTGSTGDGYQFAKSLGHSIIPPTQALTALQVNNFSYKKIAGVSFKNISLSIADSSKELKSITIQGDLLFTHKGVSGPAALHLSRYITNGQRIIINFFSELNREELLNKIKSCIQTQPKLSIKRALLALQLPCSFIEIVLKELKINEQKKAAEFSKKEQLLITEKLHATQLVVQSKEGFDTAMATAGGIHLKEVYGKTFESKITPNLYIIGELLNIDGDSGGYNLQAAFSTAFMAAQAIIHKTETISR